MVCDLKRLFSELSDSLPTLYYDENRSEEEDEDEFEFTASDFPQIPRELNIEKLLISPGRADWNGRHSTDSAAIFCERETFRMLGLLILGATLKEVPSVRLNVTTKEPWSSIKTFIVETPFRPPGWEAEDYKFKPAGLSYRPQDTDFWQPNQQTLLYPRNEDQPFFCLSNEDGDAVTDEDWKSRNILYGCGSHLGAMRFAHFLLDYGNPLCKDSGWNLEDPFLGNGGVAAHSLLLGLKILPDDLGVGDMEEFWSEGKGGKDVDTTCE